MNTLYIYKIALPTIDVNITGVRILKIEIAGSYHEPGGFGFEPTLAAGNLKVSAKS